MSYWITDVDCLKDKSGPGHWDSMESRGCTGSKHDWRPGSNDENSAPE